MERAVITRVENGVKVEIGKRVMRSSGFMLSDRPEPTWEYGAPSVTKRDDGKPKVWPEGAPPAGTVRSINGNRSACGDYLVATFALAGKYGSGPEFIVRWADIPALAQALANTPAVAEATEAGQ